LPDAFRKKMPAATTMISTTLTGPWPSPAPLTSFAMPK
jgi:hypothetical protein